MAAIFQIRRGTSNVSLTEGELYLHQGSGSIQFSSGSNVYNTLTLNAPVKGDINLIGNISASGDVRIGGNIYLGDSVATDNISALGVFTTNLVPNGTIDLGTTSAKWNNVYGNAIWGAISASNGVVSGSSQLTILNAYTSSQDTKNSTLQTYTASIDAKFTTLQSLTASNLNRLSRIEESTSSLNTFSASVNGHISDINIKTGSLEQKNTIIAAYTASMNTFTASVNGHISDINTKTGSFETKWATLQNVTSSILSYTSSLKSAIELTGSSVTILGNLVVKGTQLLVDSTTIQLGDNILELNGAASANGGLLVKDTTGISGSLLWDSTNDYWKGGTIGNEEKLLRAGSDGVVSGSLVSLNTFSASVNGHVVDINTKTGSFESKFTTLGLYTASLDTKNTTLQTLTASMAAQVARIQESTASLNTFTASQETKNSTLATYTASVSGHIVDINTKTGSFESKFTTLGLYTASLDTKNITLGLYTSSIDSKFSTLQTLTASVQSQISRIQESTASLNTFSSSINSFYNNFTASTDGFSASVDNRLDQLEYTASYGSAATTAAQFSAVGLATGSLISKTGSYATTGSNSFDGSQQITGSLLVSQNITGSASASFVSLAVNTTTPAQKIHLKGAVGIENGTTGGNTADQFVFGYAGSGLTQYTHKIQTGHDAQAALNKMDFFIANSSNTWKTPLQLRHDRVITSGSAYVTGDLIVTGSINGTINATNGVVSGSSQTIANLPTGIVSGSSQVNFTQLSGISNGIVSGSSQTIANLPAGTVSGSIQVLGSSTIMSGSTNNYQFNSIGVGSTTAASGVNGEIRAQGDITAYYSSDERLKENIQPIVDALSKVESISGNTYDWKEGFETIHSHTGHDIGVIAQEIEKVLPEVVTDRETGYKAVQYEKIVPLLIEAIKELSAKVKELESK